MTGRYRFRAGDQVLHHGTGETWFLACDEDSGTVPACGWPETFAYARDCELIESATDEQRLEMLFRVGVIRGDGRRASLAREQLFPWSWCSGMRALHQAPTDARELLNRLVSLRCGYVAVHQADPEIVRLLAGALREAKRQERHALYAQIVAEENRLHGLGQMYQVEWEAAEDMLLHLKQENGDVE